MNTYEEAIYPGFADVQTQHGPSSDLLLLGGLWQ
jgi:hypothetical protein